MSALAEYTRLKEEAEERQREANEARGAYNATIARLKADFGCDSLKAARLLLEKNAIELQRLDSLLETELEKWITQYKEKL